MKANSVEISCPLICTESAKASVDSFKTFGINSKTNCGMVFGT